MSDSADPLEQLRQVLNSTDTPLANDSVRRLRRLAHALLSTGFDEEAHQRCQERLPELAVAAQRGARVAALFPEEVAHLDVCETCAGDYADLLDDLAEMEAGVGQPFAEPPPAPRPSWRARLGQWLSDLVRPLVERLDLDDAEGVEWALQDYWELLPRISDPTDLHLDTSGAMAFGGQGNQTLLLLITSGFATQFLLSQYSQSQLRSLWQSGDLFTLAEHTATRVAHEVALDSELQKVFINGYVAHVKRDPEAFMQLATRPDQP
ncbi:MAG: hypothetical protein KF893_09930 [Caldilineaceae bacterium]|nr:hypothetical protein [Caldilineaceae bacterium]